MDTVMNETEQVATLRAQIAHTLWRTEKLRIMGLDESYLESYTLGESLQSQLHRALAEPGSLTSKGS
jgi:hypothetical protein